jgi:hypothetical protein
VALSCTSTLCLRSLESTTETFIDAIEFDHCFESYLFLFDERGVGGDGRLNDLRRECECG